MQTAHQFRVQYKPEVTFNTAPGATTPYRFRPNSGPGLSQQRVVILPGEIRPDLQSPMGRLGSGVVTGSYPCDLSVGTFDPLLEALFRSTWVPATAITVDGSGSLTSFTVTDTNTVTFAGSSSLLTLGLRVGDVVRFTNMTTAANNNINLRIKTVGANTFDVHGTPLTVQAADTTATLTILKKLKNSDTAVRRSFYFEQHAIDIDQALVFGGVRVAGCRIQGTPDGMALAEFRLMGASQSELATGGSSPYFDSTSPTTSIALVFVDAVISFGGSDVTKLTQVDIDIDLGTGNVPVVGTFVPPDIFDNRMSITGSIGGIREDLTRITAFRNETEYELHILLTEPETEPKDCISLFIPRVKLTSVEAPIGGDNAQIETSNFITAKKEGFSSTGYDDTTATLCTSAAP